MSARTRWAALASAAAVLLALVLAAAPAAHGQESAVEVRVAAQRLLDGRTEFALQERRADGTWGERRLPARRIFPASAAVGRWLSSSELTIEAQPDSMTAATSDPDLEARVAAQLLADGRMEFALQERRADGEWEERRLPTRRIFPANATVGRWLSSSSLTVEVPSDSMLAATPTAACVLVDNVDRVTAATFQVQTATGTGTAFYIGNGEWITNHHVVDTVSSAALVHGATRLNATVTGSLPSYDLALLGARPPTSVPALTFASTRPSLASDLMVVGFPAWVESTPSVTRGVVSKHAPFSTHYSGRAGTVIQVDAPVNPGNSGGPIADNCGTIVGVATFGYDTTRTGRPVEGINFGVAAETVVAQLVGLRSSTHHARGSVTVTAATSTTLEITAVCNSEDSATSDACRVAGARGLHSGQPSVFIRGVENWDNVYYSIGDGEAREYAWLRDLGRGRHTVRVNERRAGGWTGWSAPYTFTITDPAPMEIRAICNGDWADYSTSDDCFAAGSGGILAEDSPVIWTLGVAEWANILYSIDGGAALARADLNLRHLAAGFHTIHVSEQQAAGWTGWSEPYAFTITGAAPIEITAICNRNDHGSSHDCRAAGASGILAERDPSIWRRGMVNSDNVRYSIDGGAAVASADLNLRNLAAGFHTIHASEQQAAGWTGWSEPYAFTITGAAPIEITAICNRDDHESGDDCRTAGASGILAEGDPSIWRRGMVNSDNVRYSIDGGAAVASADLNLRNLAAGFHTIHASEQQAAGWTGWSEPYAFTITGAAPIEITAICNRDDHESGDDCRTAGASGILAEGDPSIWRRGMVNSDNVRYSIDGGAAVAREDFTLRNLTGGRHQIRLSEQQPAGWTGWSEPYWFTITGAAPLEILAFCDYPGEGATREDCHATRVTRDSRHWLWPRGTVDQANVRFSVDGGSAVAWEDLNLIALRDGRHNIRIGEQQAAGWTGWSEPYWFTIRE